MTTETKLSPIEFRILRYMMIHNGETILIKDIARTTNLSKQTVSKHVNKFVNSGDIQRDGKQFTIINPYIWSVLKNE